MISLLIVSAVAFEAKPTLEMLEKHNIEYEYFEIGIGPINAAKSAHILAEKVKNRCVIYVGSAGSFDIFKEPYLVTVDEVFWMPTAERMGTAKYMENLHPPISISPANLQLEVKKVLTSSSVSLKNDIVVELADRTQLIENMELYSVISELSSAKSLNVIFGITNGIGPEGSSEWFKNFKLVSKMTADYIDDHLDEISIESTLD